MMQLVEPGTRLTFTRAGHAYALSYPDGSSRRVRSVTAISGSGRAAALERWHARITAEHAVRDWDVLAGMDEAGRLQMMLGYAEAERSRAAMRGTAVHSAAESLARGDAVFLSDDPEQAAMVRAYARWLSQPQQEWLRGALIEQRVLLPGRGWMPPVAGCADMIAVDSRGRRIVIDLKTSRSEKPPRAEWAAQMWAYGQGHLVGDDGLVSVERPARPVAAMAVMICPTGVRTWRLAGAGWRQAGRMWDGLRRYQCSVVQEGAWDAE